MNTLGSGGEALIKSFETLTLTAYPDSGGVPTIGWGHTRGVQLGDTCTAEQAEDWFVEDTQAAIEAIDTSLTTHISQPQFDALVSFTFNVGSGAEAHSTLIKLINARRFASAAAEFLKWIHVEGVPSAGLERRRKAEQALFLS